MNTINQITCQRCEEQIHENALNCPYCGAVSGEEQFTPPYRFEKVDEKVIEEIGEEDRSPTFEWESDLDDLDDQKEELPPIQRGTVKSSKTEDSNSDELLSFLLSMGALFSGAVFFLFGLALLFCSKEGVFTLKWNGNLWPLYSFSSIPLLFYGWKKLMMVEEESVQ